MNSRMWGAGSGSRSRLNTREQSSLLNESGTTSLSQAQQGLAAIDQLQAEREAERERERVEQLRQSVQNAADAANNWMESMQELLQQTDAAYSDGQQRSAKQIADDQAQLTAKMEELSAVKAGLEQYKDYYDADQYAGMMDGFDNMSQSWQWIQSGMNAYDTDWEEYQKLLADVSDVDWGEDVVIADPYSFYRAQASGQEGLQDLYYEDYLHSFNSAAYGKRMDALSVKDLQDAVDAAQQQVNSLTTQIQQKGYTGAARIDADTGKEIAETVSELVEDRKHAEQDLKDAQNTLKEKQEWDENKKNYETRLAKANERIEIDYHSITDRDIAEAKQLETDAKTAWEKTANDRHASVDDSIQAEREYIRLRDARYKLEWDFEDQKAEGNAKLEEMRNLPDEDKIARTFATTSQLSQDNIDYLTLNPDNLSPQAQYAYLKEQGYQHKEIQRLAGLIPGNELLNYANDLGFEAAKADVVSSWVEGNEFLASVLSIPLNLAGGVVAVAEDALGYLSGNGIDTENSIGNLMMDVGSSLRQGVGQNIDNGFWRTIYDFGMSTVDSLGAIGLGAATGNVGLSLAIMGSGSAARTIQEGKARGLSDDQAFTTGLLAGLSEVVFETINLESLKSVKEFMEKPAKTIADRIKKGLAHAGLEGSEELFTDIANFVADQIVNGDQSAFTVSVKRYQEQGLNESQAVGKALADLASQFGLSFAGGMFSGSVMAGGLGAYSSIAHSYSTIGQMTNMSGMTAQAAAFTLEHAAVDSAAYQAAVEVAGLLEAGELPSARQTGQMLQGGIQAYQQELEQTLQASMTDSGLTQIQAQGITDKLLSGDTLTDIQAQQIRDIDAVREAVSETLGVELTAMDSVEEIQSVAQDAAGQTFSLGNLLAGYTWEADSVTASQRLGLDTETKAVLKDAAYDTADIQQQTAWLNQELAQQYRQAEIQQALPQVQELASRYNDASTAQAFVQGYDGGLPANIYALGFDEVAALAQQGYSLDEIMSRPENIYSHMLTIEQAELAYESSSVERNNLLSNDNGDMIENITNKPNEEQNLAKPKPYAKSRPSYGKDQVEQVWERAKDPITGKVYDPSGAEIIWDRSKPRNGQWDMGHIPEAKYSEVHQKYMNGEMSKEEFLNWYRDPANYRPELPSTNRSHKYERRSE